MDLAEHEATDAQCAAQGLLRQCVNPRDQFPSGPDKHGDYYPKCTNTTQEETPYPALPGTPRDAAVCTEEGYAAFATAAAAGYAHTMPLDGMCGAVAFGPYATPGTPCTLGHFSWTKRADDSGVIDAKMVWNGRLGWIAIGLENPGGHHNGMNGGRIVMALPASPVSYTPVTGLALGATGPTVNEYIIHEVSSAFRHWSQPHPSSSLEASSFEQTDCFTSMSFTTHTIAGWPLYDAAKGGNATLIWGANGADAFVGYHGRGTLGEGGRGKLEVNWESGPWTPPLNTSTVRTMRAAAENAGAGRGTHHGADDAVELSVGALVGAVAGAVAAGILFAVLALVLLRCACKGTTNAKEPSAVTVVTSSAGAVGTSSATEDKL